MKDDFYIGYEPTMPASLAAPVVSSIVVLVLTAVTAAVGLVAAQRPVSPGTFEYGRARTVEGTFVAQPYPMLRLDSGARWWLVGPGKHGFEPRPPTMDGRRLRVRGTAIVRGPDRMLQVGPDDVMVLGEARAPARPLHLVAADRRFDGEIVDGKCHLGVMKPGDGPLHRDCAVLCLLGGIPPLLVLGTPAGGRVEDAAPEPPAAGSRVTLVTPDGRALDADLSRFVGRPVRLHGALYRRGDEWFLGITAAGLSAPR